MLIYTTGTPDANPDEQGDRITLSLPSGGHPVEVSLSIHEASIAAMTLYRAVEDKHQQVRRREVPEAQIYAFARDPKRSCA